VIRYGNTLPKWIADTSKISPQNPIIHRANPILQLALLKEIQDWKAVIRPMQQGKRKSISRGNAATIACSFASVASCDGPMFSAAEWQRYSG
jgi:hypothetical protein